tara:strand:+ start:58 stop:285 length:228 start_codon:yes stop_codon:yes gene_type:complete
LKLVVVVTVVLEGVLIIKPEEYREAKVILVHHLNKLKCLLLAVVVAEVTTGQTMVRQEDLVVVAVEPAAVVAEPQ